jgi:hypothetical protein
VAGSILVLYFSFRSVFIATGVILAAATLLVMLAVRETPRPRTGARRGFAELRRVDRATLRALGAIIVAQGFVQWCSSSAQGLLAVRILLLDPAGAAFASGLAFGLGGLATAASSFLYWRPATRIGLSRFAILGSVLLFVAVGVLALAPSARTGRHAGSRGAGRGQGDGVRLGGVRRVDRDRGRPVSGRRRRGLV